MPTAILSTNAAFPGYYIDDYTKHMEAYINHWKDIHLEFDAIYIGFIASLEQVDMIIDFVRYFKKQDTVVILDPIMGDHGKLYSITNPSMWNKLIDLLPFVDIITPNLTECYQLLNQSYHFGKHEEHELFDIATRISVMGPDKIVITGIEYQNRIQNYVYEKGKEPRSIIIEKIGENRAGTGDVFSSIVAGGVTKGESFIVSVQKAVEFLNQAITYTNQMNIPPRNGICFEEFLSIL
ncbi:pyridoxal kinase [Anaeromicropila herbilytica]|uniref:Pyridoxal kinase n=1 Tax=Anaeromicropila herbilytica TaxID=2785025 RepID=A0A7R7IEQ0_9FIRM|nr:pyridoxal kinase [Anaeromicropila herbilytica]